MISKNNVAYEYQPDPVAGLHKGKNYINIVEKVGCKNPTTILVLRRIATIYKVVK